MNFSKKKKNSLPSKPFSLCNSTGYLCLSRLAYKSSLERAKRDRQSSSERARSASERELAPGPFNEKRASDFKSLQVGESLETRSECCLTKDLKIISSLKIRSFSYIFV